MRRSKMRGIMIGLLAAAIMLVGCGAKTPTGEQTESVETSVSETTSSQEAQVPVKEVTLTFAAAASLKNVFDNELIPAFEAANPGVKIEPVYDSSGKLQTQIEEGLEADVFMSAATKQMNALVEGGYVEESSVVNLLENKLVLIQNKETQTKITSFEELTGDTIDVIALGDPATTPAGQYAQGLLTAMGIWDGLQPKLTLGGNVTEVLNWVESADAKAGIVYQTDAAASDKVEVVAYPDEQYLTEKVVYPVAPLKGSDGADVAQAFVDYLKTPDVLAIFESYGFTVIQ